MGQAYEASNVDRLCKYLRVLFEIILYGKIVTKIAVLIKNLQGWGKPNYEINLVYSGRIIKNALVSAMKFPHMQDIPQQSTCKYICLSLSLGLFLITIEVVYHLPNIRSFLIAITE
jgi:hypothetical protein